MAESEAVSPSNMVFIDMGTGSQQYAVVEANKPDYGTEQFPDTADIKPIKEEPVNPETSEQNNRYLPIQPRRIRCPECQRYTAENEEKMLRHIRRVHRGENPFQCYMCDYSTYNKVRFEEHVRIHQGIKPYKCSHCPYRSVSKKNTQKHEKRHSDENPFKCKQCGFLARHAVALKRHESTHGNASQKECNLCNAKLEINAYTAHRKNRKRCKDCNKLFCQGFLQQHRIEEHGLKKIKKPSVKTVLFTCSICKWEGNSKPRILLHLIHHPNQDVDETVVDTSVLRNLGIMGQDTE